VSTSGKAEVLSVCWPGAFQVFANTMPRKKDISNDLREAVVAACKSGKGYKAISKQFGVHHSTVRKIFYTSGSGRPSKFTLGQTVQCSEKLTTQELHL